MENQFRVDGLGLSGRSQRQLERMLNDFSLLTYPLHLVAGLIRTLLFMVFLVLAIMLYIGEWACTAHDDRADLIQNFNREQTIYRVNTADCGVSVAKAGEFAVDKDTFDSAFKCFAGGDSQLKHSTWWDHNWLAEKSDMFQLAYIRASYNIAALNYTISSVRAGREISSFRYAGIYWNNYVNIPNAPVVNIAFLRRTDRSLIVPAGSLYKWFTGMCLASANCTDGDYLPRNDSIYADAIYHQVTPNQAAALKALADTGSPEFWIAAAHANGIYGKDSLIASYAERNRTQLDTDILRHVPTPEEDFVHEAEIAIGCFVLFVGGIIWIAGKFAVE